MLKYCDRPSKEEKNVSLFCKLNKLHFFSFSFFTHVIFVTLVFNLKIKLTHWRKSWPDLVEFRVFNWKKKSFKLVLLDIYISLTLYDLIKGDVANTCGNIIRDLNSEGFKKKKHYLRDTIYKHSQNKQSNMLILTPFNFPLFVF